MSSRFCPLPLLALILLLSQTPGVAALPNSILESASRRRTESDRASTDEARERLARASASAAAEKARLARESANPNPLAERAASARPPEPGPEELARSLAGQTQLSNAVANLSQEGRQALNQPVAKAVIVDDADSAPPPTAPVVVAQASTSGAPAAAPQSSPAVPPPSTPAPAGAPKPRPLKPTPVQDPKTEANRTLIYSADSFFDANRAIGVFTGSVRVYKIVNGKVDLYVECDDLEVFMKKEDAPKSAQPAAATPGNAAEPLQSDAGAEARPNPQTTRSSTEAEESGIDKIRARGAMVIVEKYTETGDIQVGKCKDLSFDGATQVVTLRIWPQVQRGAHLQIADEPGTVMTISPEGHFKSSNGRTRTEILQGDAAKPKTKGLRRAPEQ